jgi:hypothetical protein
MPKAAIERGFAMRVVDLQDLPNLMLAQCGPERSRGDEAGSSKATSAGSN